MKKRINELLNGKFEDLQDRLELSEQEIYARTMEHENFSGKFSVMASSENGIHGFVQSTNPRIGLRPDSFSGMGETIRYEADVKGMAPGEVLEGEFLLNTTAGEYHLPYHIQIEGGSENKKELPALQMTREEFTALAREDFGRAYVCFLSGTWKDTIKDWHPDSQLLYDGLLAEGASYRCLEQFLVGIGEKEPIEISLETDHLIWKNVTETRKEELTLYKNTWGFTTLNISCEEDFLTVEKPQLTTEEFVGSVCHIGVIINKEKLHAGKQFARIRITADEMEKTCLVEVQNAEKKKDTHMSRLQKKEVGHMMSLYIAWRTGKKEKEDWAKETFTALENYRRAEGNHIFFELYESYVLYQIGHSVQAEMMLSQVQERKEELKDVRWKGCYLYLTTLQSQETEYLEYVRGKIQEFALQDQESWILLWLMFRVNGQVYRNDAERLEEIRRKYQMGVCSCVLYLEAMDIWKKEPLMMRRMDAFEIQLLVFLCRHGVFDPEISGQCAQLAQRKNGFHPVLFRVLTSCYAKYPTRNLLTAICRMLLEGRKCERKYAHWFAKGVMEDVRITGLYEYFVETADQLDACELPKAIRLYFVYHNTLDSGRKAAIYAAIIRSKEQDPETYRSYRKVMELFMEEQLADGKISRDLATIYEDLLTEEVMTSHLAEGLEKILFTYEVTCEKEGFRHLLVLHKELEQEQRVSLEKGKALIQLMTPHAVLLAEDEEGRRYAADAFCKKERLLQQERLASLCRRHLKEPYRFLLHDCMMEEKETGNTEKRIADCLQLLQMQALKESCRVELVHVLLDYFAEHPNHPEANVFLKLTDPEKLAQCEMEKTARILAGQGRYQELYQLICVYGMEKVDLKILVRMCSFLLSEEEAKEDRMLLEVCVYCFQKNLYDEKMLAFLMKHYEGSLELMKRIWRVGQNFKLESFELEEKILILLLFLRQGSAQTEDIFVSYEKKMGKSRICRAYVTWMSYEFFVRQMHVEWPVFLYIEQNMLGIVGTPDICKLALLKRYTERKEKSAGQQKWMIYLLEKYLQAGMRFAFMTKLPGKLKERYHLYDKYILEYRTFPEKEVVLHYRYQGGEEKSILMNETFEGIYTMEFTMFYRDTLEWYVTEEHGQDKVQKQSYTCMTSFSKHGITRYDLLNQMIRAQEKQDQTGLTEAVRRYEEQAYLADTIFGLD